MNRTLLLGAAWTASAGAAVGLGFLAVSLVDASASPVVQPVASDLLDAAETTASGGPSASPAPTAQQVTAGGTVTASCAPGATVPVLSGAPAPGWWPDDSQDPGKFEFESDTQSVEVRATCVGGVPQFVVEGPRAAGDRGGDDGGTPASSDAPDDSAGRVGGGHGADDGAGHDVGDDHGGGSNSGSGGSGGGSGGHGSGGHGSDG
jgi:hypothetical protein